MNARHKARLLLLATVLVWGSSFVAVKSALADASPLLFNLIRMTLAAAVLAAVYWRPLRAMTRAQWTGGALAGVFLAAGYQLQTAGLARTSAAKSAFITGMVVVLVPVLTLFRVVRVRILAIETRPALSWLTLTGALLAFSGLALLTTPGGISPRQLLLSVGAGDLLTMLCTMGFALHLLTLARVSPGVPAGPLAAVQIAAAALVMLLTFPLEPAHLLHPTARLLAALLFTSLFSTAAAFTVQSYAQQHLSPAETSLLLTLEPVFAVVTAALFLGERLSGRALAGAALILLSIGLVELAPGVLGRREIPA